MTPISSKRIAVFPGTFDPFTLGHMSIVSRGLELLDEVVIAIGINDSKRTYFTVEQRLEMDMLILINNFYYCFQFSCDICFYRCDIVSVHCILQLFRLVVIL